MTIKSGDLILDKRGRWSWLVIDPGHSDVPGLSLDVAMEDDGESCIIYRFEGSFIENSDVIIGLD